MLTAKFYKPGTTELVDPEEVKFIVYASPSKILLETLLDVSSRIGLGTYQTFYTMPEALTCPVFEFKGVYGGRTILNRKSVPSEWVR
jgi:hypothetical protein